MVAMPEEITLSQGVKQREGDKALQNICHSYLGLYLSSL
jgi:hypothetical protein